MNRFVSNVFKRVVFGFTSFVLVLSTVTAAVPIFLTQTANAVSTQFVAVGDLASAVNSAVAGDTIVLTGSGVVASSIIINKSITIESTTGATLNIATGINGLSIQANDVTIRGLNFRGSYVLGDGAVTRGLAVSPGVQNVLITENNFYDLRQPAYVDGGTTGFISNNFTEGSRGWVISGHSNIQFVNNSFGALAGIGDNQKNVLDLVIIADDSIVNNYLNPAVLSAMNNNAVVQNQLLGISTDLNIQGSLSPANNSATSDIAFTMSWSAVKGATKYEYRTSNTLASSTELGTVIYNDDSSASNYTLEATTITRRNSNTPENSYYWQVRAGNTNYWGEWSAISKVTVDTTRPAAPVNGQPAVTNTDDFNFTWNPVMDTGSAITEYQFQSSGSNSKDINGSLIGAWQNWISYVTPEQKTLTTPQIHSTGAPDGNYFWQVRAIDAAGNVGPWSSVWNATIDSLAPNSPQNLKVVANGLTLSSPAFTNAQDVVTSWDAVDGAVKYQYKYWNSILGNYYKENSAYTIETTATSVAGGFTEGQGTHFVQIRAIDAAGNVSEPTTPFIITYDKMAPVATISTVETNKTQPAISGTFSEADVNTFTVKLDGVKLDATRTDKDWTTLVTTPLSNSVHEVLVEGTDLAGNTFSAIQQFTTFVEAATDVSRPTPVATVAPTVGAAPYATTTPLAAAATVTATPAGEVLGASTTEQDAPAVAGVETSKDVAAEPTAKNGFNSAWYWLLTIPVAGAAWWALAAFRHRES